MEKKREIQNFRSRKIIIADQRTSFIKKQIPKMQEISQKQEQDELFQLQTPSSPEVMPTNIKLQNQKQSLQQQIEDIKQQQKESLEVIREQARIIKKLQQENNLIKRKFKEYRNQNVQLYNWNLQNQQDTELQLAIQLSSAEYNQINPRQSLEVQLPGHYASHNNSVRTSLQNFSSAQFQDPQQQYAFQMAMEREREEDQQMKQQKRRQLIQEHPELVNPDELTYEELLLLEEKMGIVSNGLNQNQIDKLLKVKITNSMASSNICQCEFAQGEIAKQLKCRHYYHSECISKWLQNKNNCPVCMKPAQ